MTDTNTCAYTLIEKDTSLLCILTRKKKIKKRKAPNAFWFHHGFANLIWAHILFSLQFAFLPLQKLSQNLTLPSGPLFSHFIPFTSRRQPHLLFETSGQQTGSLTPSPPSEPPPISLSLLTLSFTYCLPNPVGGFQPLSSWTFLLHLTLVITPSLETLLSWIL